MSSRSIDPAARPGRRVGLGRFVAVMALTFALLAGATLALPVSPYIRFQNLDDTIYSRARWIYERIHFDPTPIDVVFLGASREGAGAYPTLIEPALAARGTPAHVVNFSLASSGYDLRYTIARELLRHKPPKLLILSVVEAFPRDGHDAFGALAPVDEILGAPLIVNRNLPRNILALPVRQIGLWLETILPQAYGKRIAFDPAAYAGTLLNPRDLMDFKDDLAVLDTPEHAEKLARQAERRRREITPPKLPGSLSGIEFGVSRSYLDRIVDLAKAKGTQVVFVFLPFYTGPDGPLERAWLEQRGALWAASFMKDDPRNYEDSGHFAASPRVKALMTDWFADRISAVLTKQGGR